MRKPLVFLYIGLLLCVGATAQNAIDTSKWEMMVMGTDTVWMAKPTAASKAMDAGNYAEAVAAYRKLLKEGSTEHNDMYNLACAYALLNNKDSAFFFLDMSMDFDSTIFALSDPDLYHLISDVRWKKVEDRKLQLQAMSSRPAKYRDLRLAKELWRMGIRDQALYRDIENAEKKYSMKNPVKDSLWAIKERLNNENVSRLTQIIDDKGWPQKSAVGSRAASVAFLIVQHSDLETQKKYLPMLMAAANIGEAEWSSLALLIDRIEMGEGRPQIYGSQVSYNTHTKKYEPYQVVDEQHLDKRRKAAGLGSAREYYSRWQINYNVPQAD
jgi:hypothetical protein